MRGRAKPTKGSGHGIGERIVEAIDALCHPEGGSRASVLPMAAIHLATAGDGAAFVGAAVHAEPEALDVDALVRRLYTEHAPSLVRMARLFVDDRNAAEDLVQEAFIRFARHAHRIEDGSKSAAYLRSIVLNLARDHNRRGLVSLRHRAPADEAVATAEDEVVLRDDQRQVIEALRELPLRQRDCVVLRYYFEAGIQEISDTLGISPNSVKTHLKRGLAALERRLEDSR
ncbi:MAG: SigE family RNA polymerase sigma factor [Acidimicrobiales bacterium]